MKETEFLIVGQGIAGTHVAWFLEKAGRSFHIIDNAHAQSSTKIAGGLINPITGRRFVKSWRIEDLLPFAKTTYQEMEEFTKMPLFKELAIIRYFQSIAEGNNWVTKTAYEGYEKYLRTDPLQQDLSEIINDSGGYGIVNGAKVQVGPIIHFFQQYYLQKERLHQEQFDYSQLVIQNEGVQYKDIHAKTLIFCEGFSAKANPWFTALPFESAKGEVLILKIPQLSISYIIKKNQFIVPLEKDLFWFGSNYEWDDLTNIPTAKGKAYLEERLADILKVDYEIVDHLAGVRPVLKDRRPALGRHPAHRSIAILNGLGTKGASIGPYWAKHLVDHLLEGTVLDTEVDIGRFFN